MNLRMLVLAGGRECTIDHYSAPAAAGLQVTAADPGNSIAWGVVGAKWPRNRR